ncbi:MAG: hypothetical protein ACKVOH_02430 [Chlamydiales bacterium]
MLRIQRVKKDFRVLLHKRESRFTQSMWRGFLLSLGVHLLFVLLFRVVSPAQLNVIPLPPSCVEIDLGKPQRREIAQQRAFLTSDTELSPQLFDFALSEEVCSIDNLLECCYHEPDFSDIEELDYTPLKIEFDDDSN